jgi:hypothetical protein
MAPPVLELDGSRTATLPLSPVGLVVSAGKGGLHGKETGATRPCERDTMPPIIIYADVV